jgi:collagenase-like PrtC family protease
MILKNGKFYDGDKEVPLEFGNKEQIKLLREVDRRAEMLQGEGLEIEIVGEEKWTLMAQFRCICSNQIFFEDDNCDDELDINGLCKDRTCRKCKRVYSVEGGDPGELIIKLKP